MSSWDTKASTIVIMDTLGRTWKLIEVSHHRGPTRWAVYCESQCVLITQQRNIALAYMPKENINGS